MWRTGGCPSVGPGAVSQAWQVWIWHMKVMVLRAGHVPGTVLGAEDFSVKESWLLQGPQSRGRQYRAYREELQL